MEVRIYYGGGNFLRSFISYHVIFEPNVWLPKQQSNFLCVESIAFQMP